ncbi:MAG: OmpA family protein [Planctomycetes bacterium]|nr:OmpA family protein [Planctomycetota bacterium]
MNSHLRYVLVGGLALASLTATGCGSSKRQLAYAKVQISELERENQRLDAELAACRADQGHGAPVAPVNPGDGSPANTGDVQWDGRAAEQVATISNEILFKPGSAVLGDKAKKVLNDVISTIKSKYPDASVRVEGHTDDQDIKRSKDEHKDNWDLSGNRSQAVLHYLIDHGIAPAKAGFAGYGKERPVASNASNDGKAKNRRVEIVVITGGGASGK